tara:strand:- start:1450 stop:2040 length:591 start_codon:yes stop_codon:yes gene_type:complete
MLKKIGILGDIGSGKSLISNQFGCPVFNADKEVNKIYKKNISCFNKLKNKLPKYIKSHPINKMELINAILSNKKNLRTIVSVVHPIIKKEMNLFLKKNMKKKIVVLDIPLLIENKLNKKKDILIFIDAQKKEINLRLKKRINYNKKLIENLRKIQKPLSFKKKLSTYVIKNNFKLLSIKKRVKLIKRDILNERNST